MKKKYLIGSVLLLFVFVMLSHIVIEIKTRNKVYSNLNSIPVNKVGLVLGTSKTLQNGSVNMYFKYRIDATVELYKAGKIKYVLVSGDNSSVNYDEPTDFKNELIKRGIPSEKIVLDYAGFRTLDSVVRAKEIFGQHNITIISQEFHNRRAVFIANRYDINAVAFNAKDVSAAYGIKVYLREYLARTKVFLDIIFKVQPKYLGKKIRIE